MPALNRPTAPLGILCLVFLSLTSCDSQRNGCDEIPLAVAAPGEANIKTSLGTRLAPPDLECEGIDVGTAVYRYDAGLSDERRDVPSPDSSLSYDEIKLDFGAGILKIYMKDFMPGIYEVEPDELLTARQEEFVAFYIYNSGQSYKEYNGEFAVRSMSDDIIEADFSLKMFRPEYCVAGCWDTLLVQGNLKAIKRIEEASFPKGNIP